MKKSLILAVIVLLLGGFFVLLGGLFKIQHWVGGSYLIIAGFGLQLLAGIGLFISLIRRFRAQS